MECLLSTRIFESYSNGVVVSTVAVVTELIVVDVVVVVVVEVVEVALRFGFDILAIFLSSNYEVIQDTDQFEL